MGIAQMHAHHFQVFEILMLPFSLLTGFPPVGWLVWRRIAD